MALLIAAGIGRAAVVLLGVVIELTGAAIEHADRINWTIPKELSE